jgi:hypothetical protein
MRDSFIAVDAATDLHAHARRLRRSWESAGRRRREGRRAARHRAVVADRAERITFEEGML